EGEAEDFGKPQPIDSTIPENVENIDQIQDLTDLAEESLTNKTAQEQNMPSSSVLDQDHQALDYIEPTERIRPKRERIPTSKPRTVEPLSPGSYYRILEHQRTFFKELSDDEIDSFFARLAQGDIDDVLGWSLLKMENYLFEALKRVQLIGELPISQASFNQLCQYNQDIRLRRTDGRLSRQKTIPPAFFITMMVFCARYSEEDARNFWRPYSLLVWGLDEADQSFQNVCRDHFRACREDLADTVGLNFHIYRDGDVVLPVYQHAIIPFHLMEHMANWIVQNFELFLKFDLHQLQHLISDKEALRYLPHQLQRFLTDEDTSQAVATLLDKMADAIALFKEKSSDTLVETIIESPIEKSLWQAIYSELIADTARVENLVRVQPKLDWVWMMAEEDLGLCLSGVQSPPDQKPNTLYVTSDKNFKTATHRPSLSPWLDKEKGWELDKIVIPSDALINNDEVFVVSDQFNLDKSPDEQQPCVLYAHKIPAFGEDCIFFRHGLNQKHARRKDTIDSNGEWIIISKTDYDLQNPPGESLPYSAYNLPHFLRDSGFKHGRKFDIKLPTLMVCDEKEIQIQEQDGRKYLEPTLEGDHPVLGISDAVPPVFQTQSIYLSFGLDPQYSFRRTFFSISSKRSGYMTLSLAELKRRGQLTQSDTAIQITLETFIGAFGQYQIDIIHGLRSLLDEPLAFGYLPDIIISPPDKEIVFSPKNPFKVKLNGVFPDMLDYPEDAKLFSENEDLVLKWKLHKVPQCSFSINDGHGGHVKLLWEIERVTAWVDGGFNKNLIEAGQETKAGLNVRGKPFQEFNWIINTETISPDKLDVRGEYSKILRDTQIRDILREMRTSLSEVEIDIENMRWAVFQYMKKPKVGILDISYKNRLLKFKLSLSKLLRGQYKLQIMKKGALAAPVAVQDVEILSVDNFWNTELSEGDYVLEIYLDNELLTTSQTFSHRKRISVAPNQEEVSQEEVEELSAEALFSILTADQFELQKYQKNIGFINPFLLQLLCISEQGTWYADGKVEEGIKNSIPFWAVTKHPFRFVERKFHKSLIIYPEETAIGGKVGRGHTYLKVDNKPVIVYAAWKPNIEEEYVKLLLCFPDKNIPSELLKPEKVSKWNIDHTRPAYQCVDCGDLLGSGAGGFPPNIFSQHLHGKQRKAYEQFIDTRHNESLDNTLSLVEDETLDITGSVQESIVPKYLEHLLKDPKLKRFGDLSKPINTKDNLDFCRAFTELYENSKTDEKAIGINDFVNNSNIFDELEMKFIGLSNEIIAFSAMDRLVGNLTKDDSLSKIPKFTLMLCMLLRFKANLPHRYNQFMASTKISENVLMKLTESARQGFPKLLEWSIAWAEIFFVHSIS
ncbi:MAG: hypothetical protein SCH68_09500, partial [Brevefilum sp.]|nr:hypothetical protein [Brevefilum sp.]